MYLRDLSEALSKASLHFPAIVLTGSRQTGKSTLCQQLFAKTHRHVSLEDPDIRRQALEDPRTFLKMNPPPVIFDEIQYAPEIPSYLQRLIDANRKKYGQYILTGSQNFLLMEQVSQSLAGRAALFTLYPCSVSEAFNPSDSHSDPSSVADWILRGGYPELRSRPELDRRLWCASYIRLYLERDVRKIIQVGDLDTFERFIRLVAIRTGQILNLSDLARDTGISSPTAARWLSILQTSYQVHLLQPYYANLSKRLVKSPKIYFGDTALASYLMGIHEPEPLLQGPFMGALFETAVFLEHLKWGTRAGDIPNLYFLRTKQGVEADLLIEEGNILYATEIKSSRTIIPQMASQLLEAEKILKKSLKKSILGPVDKKFELTEGVTVRPWHQVAWSSY